MIDGRGVAHVERTEGFDVDPSTPVALAVAAYPDGDGALADLAALAADDPGTPGHLVAAVLVSDRSGSHRVERHDGVGRRLAWGRALLGGALVLVAPAAGARHLASGGSGAGIGAGAVVDHLRATLPAGDAQRAADVLASARHGLVVVAVDRRPADVDRLVARASRSFSTGTTWGDLDAAIEREAAEAQINPSGT
jgi:hypothetical protein